MVKGKEVTTAEVPEPGVKPETPYSTSHEVAVPTSVHVTASMLESRLANTMS